jgi:flavorubredoxin
MPRTLTVMLRHLKPQQIRTIILSHQDPDIVGGLSTWLGRRGLVQHLAGHLAGALH